MNLTFRPQLNPTSRPAPPPLSPQAHTPISLTATSIPTCACPSLECDMASLVHSWLTALLHRAIDHESNAGYLQPGATRRDLLFQVQDAMHDGMMETCSSASYGHYVISALRSLCHISYDHYVISALVSPLVRPLAPQRAEEYEFKKARLQVLGLGCYKTAGTKVRAMS